jgi:hypothetical protein
MFLSRIVSRLKHAAFGSRSSPVSEMSCGDCSRVKSCGLPPHRDCEERLAQIEMAERYNLSIRRYGAAPPDAGF